MERLDMLGLMYGMRRVGHTYTALHGVLNTDNGCLLTLTYDTKRWVQNKYDIPPHKIMTSNDLITYNYRGKMLAPIMDNEFFMNLCRDLHEYVTRIEIENRTLRLELKKEMRRDETY